MNNVVLLGRLTKEPEVRYTQSGKAVCQFTIAVNRPFSNQNGEREADFIPIVLWGKPAETAGNHLQKGQRVLIQGRIQNRSYEAQDGTKRYVTEVIGNSFEFIEKKDTSQSSNNSTQNSPMNNFGSEVFPEEDIPF